MKFPRIITRKRLKWTGLAATLLLGAAMIASHWYWPSYLWVSPRSNVGWQVSIKPGTMIITRDGSHGDSTDPLGFEWNTRAHFAQLTSPGLVQAFFHFKMPAWQWRPRYSKYGKAPDTWRLLDLPFWMPLVLAAFPTTILFYRDRNRKPGCCAKCRYDLTGLSGDMCPECGTKITPTKPLA